MSRLRRLLAEARPGPWLRTWGGANVHWMGGDDALQDMRDIDLAVAAVNALPEMLALMDAARAVIACGASNRSGDKYAAKRAALDALDDALDAIENPS